MFLPLIKITGVKKFLTSKKFKIIVSNSKLDYKFQMDNFKILKIKFKIYLIRKFLIYISFFNLKIEKKK